MGKRVEYDQKQQTLSRDNQRVKLDPIINSLLQLFLNNPNKTLTREQISESVWPNVCVSDDAMNRAISVLRKALSAEREAFVLTVRGQGYRFINSDKINLTNTPVNNTDTNKTKAFFGLINHTSHRLRIVVYAISIIAVAALYFYDSIWNQQLPGTDVAQTHPATNNTTILLLNKPVIEHAVKKSAEHRLSSDLHNKILMELALIPEVAVVDKEHYSQNIGKPNSFTINTNIIIHESLAKIMVKLINLQTKQVYPASFNLNVQQSHLSKEVSYAVAHNLAAFVRLSLQQKKLPTGYHALLNKMLPADIEKLTDARSKLIKHEVSTDNALLIIEDLLKKYPDITKIKGAFAVALNLSNINLLTFKELDKNIQMAQKVLSHSPDNYDALTSLFYSYALHPQYRMKAFEIAEQLILHYPNDPGAWYAMLYANVSTYKPCADISASFVKHLSKDILPSAQTTLIKQLLTSCTQGGSHKEFEDAVNLKVFKLKETDSKSAKITLHAFYKLLAFFSLRIDDQLISTQEHLRYAPRNTYRYNLFQMLLMLNRSEAARPLLSQFEGRTAESWIESALLLAEVEQINLQGNDRLSDFPNKNLTDINRSVMLPITTAALIKRSQGWHSEDKKSAFKKLLESLPSYSMNLDSVEHSIAVIAAQFHAGEHKASMRNAYALYQNLNKYYQNHSESFKFWGLAKYQLISALYCQQACKDVNTEKQTDLLARFYSDEVYWTHHHELIKQLLLPFNQSPMVKTYLERISKDRSRAEKELS